MGPFLSTFVLRMRGRYNPRRMATKLEQLLIKEISGVDDPANEIPGFMVLKSADGEATPTVDETVTPSEATDDTSIVQRIRNLLTGKEDLEMNKDELTAVLDEREDALVEKFAAIVAKSVEAPVVKGVEETETPVIEETPVVAEIADVEPAMTAADITKAIEDVLAPVVEALDKTLDRVERLESTLPGLAIRKSLDGQEGDETPVVHTPTLGDAIGAALKGRKVTLS